MILYPKSVQEILDNYQELIDFVKDCGSVYWHHVEEYKELLSIYEAGGDCLDKLVEIYRIYTPRMGSYGEGISPGGDHPVAKKYEKYTHVELMKMFYEKNEAFRQSIKNYFYSRGFTDEDIERLIEERRRKREEEEKRKKRKKTKKDRDGQETGS
ncbi:MAG: hypothetical protein HPY78_03990 [Brevinematales bacterium]|nr:hypothetical protein [Brevinematales bacterium]